MYSDGLRIITSWYQKLNNMNLIRKINNSQVFSGSINQLKYFFFTRVCNYISHHREKSTFASRFQEFVLTVYMRNQAQQKYLEGSLQEMMLLEQLTGKTLHGKTSHTNTNRSMNIQSIKTVWQQEWRSACYWRCCWNTLIKH